MGKKSRHVAVLMGGPSSEREVSLVSGNAVAEALESRGFEVTKVAFDENAYTKLNELKPDVAFIALHGKPGEDGTVQGMLEILGIPYTGSGVLASALAIDQARTREFLAGHDIPMPGGRAIRNVDEMYGAIDELKAMGIGFPLIVKPSSAGSSVGLSRVYEEESMEGGGKEG